MKAFFCFGLLLGYLNSGAQPKFEIREFVGTVHSFKPGFRFAYEQLCLEINGQKDCFLFYPEYGKFLLEHVGVGSVIELRANVNVNVRESRTVWAKKNGEVPWFLFRDQIEEIKINNSWKSLSKVAEAKESMIAEIFLNQPVISEYVIDGFSKGVLLANGVFLFNQGIGKHYDPLLNVKVGDLISSVGAKMPAREGYLYPLPGVKHVYQLSVLKKERVETRALLFKQNHACIGAKFMTESGKEISVSFPSYRAKQVSEFMKPDQKVEIFFGEDYETTKFSLPELHAIIQGTDTLKIEEFGFYGGADGKHDHNDVGLVGKITHLERTAKGNVASIIINSQYYVEIDPLLAQQLGFMFRKGLMISILGKERIKLEGEIYKKDYKIVVPDKIIVDGKTFSRFEP